MIPFPGLGRVVYERASQRKRTTTAADSNYTSAVAILSHTPPARRTGPALQVELLPSGGKSVAAAAAAITSCPSRLAPAYTSRARQRSRAGAALVPEVRDRLGEL